jgi:hypothetical protein
MYMHSKNALDSVQKVSTRCLVPEDVNARVISKHRAMRDGHVRRDYVRVVSKEQSRAQCASWCLIGQMESVYARCASVDSPQSMHYSTHAQMPTPTPPRMTHGPRRACLGSNSQVRRHRNLCSHKLNPNSRQLDSINDQTHPLFLLVYEACCVELFLPFRSNRWSGIASLPCIRCYQNAMYADKLIIIIQHKKVYWEQTKTTCMQQVQRGPIHIVRCSLPLLVPYG